MSVCRSCLRTSLRLLQPSGTSSLKVSSLPGLSKSRIVPPQRHYATTGASDASSLRAAPVPRQDHQTEDQTDREWNSFTLRKKVEHLLNMKDPEAARRLLQKVKVSQSVYSWNLVIKQYAHMADYPSAYKTYQQVASPPPPFHFLGDGNDSAECR